MGVRPTNFFVNPGDGKSMRHWAESPPAARIGCHTTALRLNSISPTAKFAGATSGVRRLISAFPVFAVTPEEVEMSRGRSLAGTSLAAETKNAGKSAGAAY